MAFFIPAVMEIRQCPYLAGLVSGVIVTVLVVFLVDNLTVRT